MRSGAFPRSPDVSVENKYLSGMMRICQLTGTTLLCLIVLGRMVLLLPPQMTAHSLLPMATNISTPTPKPLQVPAVDYARLVPVPPRYSLNPGLTYATPDYVRRILGTPGAMTDDCSAVTNARLSALLVTQNVGPTTVTGLKPAVEALQRIFAAVQRDHPDLYTQLLDQEFQLKDEAMLCVRRVAGLYPPNYSLHAWGIAVDISINRELDVVGDGKVQLGLLELYPYFHAEGFYWGAAFQPYEDAMHFEASRELLDRWRKQGLLEAPSPSERKIGLF